MSVMTLAEQYVNAASVVKRRDSGVRENRKRFQHHRRSRSAPEFLKRFGSLGALKESAPEEEVEDPSFDGSGVSDLLQIAMIKRKQQLQRFSLSNSDSIPQIK